MDNISNRRDMTTKPRANELAKTGRKKKHEYVGALKESLKSKNNREFEKA